MQKQAKSHVDTGYPVEYSSFEKLFQEDPGRLVIECHQPDCQPIESLHHHDGVEVGYCESGSGVFFIDGQNLPFSAPCVTVLYPGQFHKAYSTGEENSRWIFVTFRPEAVFPRNSLAVSRLPWKNAAAENALSSASELTMLGQALADECAKSEPDRDDCLRGLLAALLILHGRLPRRETENRENRLSTLERLHPVLQYIDQHYTEELTAEQLARQMFIHPATLRDWFRDGVGQTPMRYVHRVRISVACSLLRGTGRPITEVAGEAGYRSLSSFNRHFQEICGLSPTEYRRG